MECSSPIHHGYGMPGTRECAQLIFNPVDERTHGGDESGVDTFLQVAHLVTVKARFMQLLLFTTHHGSYSSDNLCAQAGCGVHR
jgi:hypothetical protein